MNPYDVKFVERAKAYIRTSVKQIFFMSIVEMEANILKPNSSESTLHNLACSKSMERNSCTE